MKIIMVNQKSWVEKNNENEIFFFDNFNPTVLQAQKELGAQILVDFLSDFGLLDGWFFSTLPVHKTNAIDSNLRISWNLPSK